MATPIAEEEHLGAQIHVTVAAGISAVTIAPGTALHEEARQLLSTQFARVQTSTGDTPTYAEATATTDGLTIPIAVCQVDSSASQPQQKLLWFRLASQTRGALRPARLLATARIELAGATLIESMIVLRPGSRASQALEHATVAEIGSFATTSGLAKVTLLEVVDAIVAVALRIAHERKLDQLWIFPRNGFMSLMRAEIPGLLLPYHFALCEDVVGWNEGSAQLRRFRAMHLRGLGKWPDIFSINRSQLEEDLARRRRGIEARRARAVEVERSLPAAMLRAQRMIKSEADALHATRATHATMHTPSHVGIVPVARQRPDTAPTSRSTSPEPASHTGFLPFADVAGSEGQYLRDVVERGGDAASRYKHLSYQLLELGAGHRVLDVGCGSGVDLAALSAAVGPAGRVVGIDHSPQRVDEARAVLDTIAGHTHTHTHTHAHNITVLLGNAEAMTLPASEFDRVRADRVLQHVQIGCTDEQHQARGDARHVQRDELAHPRDGGRSCVGCAGHAGWVGEWLGHGGTSPDTLSACQCHIHDSMSSDRCAG